MYPHTSDDDMEATGRLTLTENALYVCVRRMRDFHQSISRPFNESVGQSEREEGQAAVVGSVLASQRVIISIQRRRRMRPNGVVLAMMRAR
jgi:hypothetical protein